jgi:putative acetyltransferase
VDIAVEDSGDFKAVRDLHLAAFGDHGNVVVSLVEDLRRSITTDNGLSLVAVDGGTVAGHVMFTRSLLDAPRQIVEVQVLSPVGVLPEWQHRGVGSALISRGLDVMSRRRVPIVFLEGPPDYYSRFGFEPGASLSFRKPSLRIPDAAFQALRLPAYQAWMTGTLVYSESFWRHDAVGLRDHPTGLGSAYKQTGASGG